MVIFHGYVKLPEGNGWLIMIEVGKTVPFLPAMTGNGK